MAPHEIIIPLKVTVDFDGTVPAVANSTVVNVPVPNDGNYDARLKAIADGTYKMMLSSFNGETVGPADMIEILTLLQSAGYEFPSVGTFGRGK